MTRDTCVCWAWQGPPHPCLPWAVSEHITLRRTVCFPGLSPLLSRILTTTDDAVTGCLRKLLELMVGVWVCVHVLWIFILVHTVVSVSQHSHLYVTFGKKMRWKQILPHQNILLAFQTNKILYVLLVRRYFQWLPVCTLFAIRFCVVCPCSMFYSSFLWTLFHNSKRWYPHTWKNSKGLI